MSLGLKVFPLFALMAIGASATVMTYSISGPWSSTDGACIPLGLPGGENHCIDGSTTDFDILGATLSIDNVADTISLNVQTDYPGTINASGTGFNPEAFDGTSTSPNGYGSFNIGDFLMFVNGSPIGGIALSSHGTDSTSVTGGDLYLNSGGNLDACQVAGGTSTTGICSQLEFPSGPVWLDSGSGQTGGTGMESVTANAGANGTSTAFFTVSDTIDASSSAISSLVTALGGGTDSFEISSFICANGTAEGIATAESSSVPEPRNLLFVPAFLLAACFLRRRLVRVTA